MKKLSERLAAFISERDGMQGLDPEIVHGANGVFLNLSDLKEAAGLARSFEAAPKVKVRGKVGEVCMVPISHDFCGKRVRIVPEKEG